LNIRGIEIELHEPGEALSDHIRRESDFFEAEILDYLSERYPIQREILDIGANIGNHALYFANFFQYYDKIICFEPVPENFNILTRNMSNYAGINLYEYALSDKKQLLTMARNWSNMGASMVATNGDLKVPAFSLDSKHYFQNVTLMKIDVEEYEPQVLEGAMDTIWRCHPIIVIEDWHDAYKQLLPPNYQCVRMWEIGKTFIYEWKD
jgi:FkbM family methyltransferase